MDRYRIIEDGFGFTVQVKTVKVVKKYFIFWLKSTNEIIKWVNVASDGDISCDITLRGTGLRLYNQAIPPFKTLLEATDFINKVTKKPIIHHINEQ